MMVVAAAVVVFGFAKTYYLKEFFGTPALPLLLHVHGLVMSSWLVLLITQTWLVEAHRVQVHKRLGIAGGYLAFAILCLGTTAGIWAARSGHAPPGIPPLAFLVVPLGDMLVFATLIGAAFYYRQRPELHKRLMLVGTLGILGAGVARWPVAIIQQAGPVAYFGIPDLLIIGCAIFDTVRTRRLSPAYLWGGLFVILSHPARFLLASTSAWMTFAHWITRV
jgi:hypothetical protein